MTLNLRYVGLKPMCQNVMETLNFTLGLGQGINLRGIPAEQS